MGIGWGLEILDEEMMQGAPLGNDAHELIHKLRVKLWYKLGDQRGEVVQFGQTTFVGKNRHGLYTDEEAPKKSLTDGMSKCLSLLGFSADIHLGRYDDNKYVANLKQEFAEKAKAEEPKVADAQVSELTELIAATDTDESKFLRFFKVNSLSDLSAKDFDRAKQMLNKKQRGAA